MNRYKAFCVVVLLAMTTAGVFAQTKKTIRERGIVSMTVNEYFLEEGIDEPVMESFERYDENGELLEIKELNRRGEVRRWERYTYNEDGLLAEEIFLDERGRVVETEKNIYKDGLRVEKHYFNSRGKLYKKKEYLYEYSQ